MNLRERKTRRF